MENKTELGERKRSLSIDHICRHSGAGEANLPEEDWMNKY